MMMEILLGMVFLIDQERFSTTEKLEQDKKITTIGMQVSLLQFLGH
jgi:hypothetical protein|tara:strand:+ start:225 stop:362 length:138 start_codon:yes stop_codon:yes gene_type:complete